MDIEQLPAEEDRSTSAPGSSGGAIPAASPVREAKTRLCALCTEPVRAGQPLIRVHGSTIHARCSATSR